MYFIDLIQNIFIKIVNPDRCKIIVVEFAVFFIAVPVG
jgi:hypothetical protein